MDNTEQFQTVISIGPGMRGLERGIERAGTKLSVAAYVEVEAFIIQNLVGQIEKGVLDPAPIWADIKTFPHEQFHYKIHGIVAGYPCQGESYAGLRKQQDDPRFIWPYIRKTIKSIRPVWCFFENVSGHLSGSFQYVLKDLRDLGYSVEAGIYTAAEVGAPHKRERLFILAVDDTANGRHSKQPKTSFKNGIKRSKKNGFMANGSEGSSQELGNAKSDNKSREGAKESNEKGQIGGSGIESKLGNSKRFGLSGNNRGQSREIVENRCEILSNTQLFRGNKGFKSESSKQFDETGFNWPAGRGEQQKDCEHPRTIKSGLGCTVDGYNFRADLLRMLGNGVVEQTAALAWVELWEKHFNNQII